MERKLSSLKDCINDLDGEIHPTKSHFIVVNATDTTDFILENIHISYVESYTYLGTPISNNSISEQVKQHLASKIGHAVKLTAFLFKNSEATYKIKKQVWMCALQSAVFYSCETWLTADLRAADSVYMSSLKQLLGVR